MEDCEGFWVHCDGASSSFLELPAAAYNHHEAVAMRTMMKMILSVEWKEIWRIGKALGLVVLLLPSASSSFLQLPAAPYSHHEVVAMRATRKLVISTEWKEVWTIGKGSVRRQS